MNELNGIINRFALFDNGIKVTDFNYEGVKEKNGVYILWNEDQVVLYDKTMTKKLEINGNICRVFFKENYFIVRFLDKKGFGSKVLTNAAYGYDGKVLVAPYKYTHMCSYEQVIITYSRDSYNEMYMYNLEGKELITPMQSFEGIYPRRKGVIVQKDGKYGFYSYEGVLLLPIIYDDPYDFMELVKNMKVNIMDETLSDG